MTTIDSHHNPASVGPSEPGWKRYLAAPHFRNAEDEFDACKLGFWLFLSTEVLLFAGLFCAYAMFRMLYPDAFAVGSHHLNMLYGGTNTVVLLLSSFTVAMSIRCAQTDNQKWLHINLVITILCALLFFFIKFFFEYIPKWSAGIRPGILYSNPFPGHPQEPTWWSVYYAATGIHALHVLIGASLLGWCLYRSLRHKAYGPTHYTMLENSGLYWHLVDLIWIFLFPLLYLID